MSTLPDGRTVPAPHADERLMLENWLDFFGRPRAEVRGPRRRSVAARVGGTLGNDAAEVVAAASLDDSGKVSDAEAALVGGHGLSLRWILVHMIEEYARHDGHADLLRERIDGVTGP